MDTTVPVNSPEMHDAPLDYPSTPSVSEIQTDLQNLYRLERMGIVLSHTIRESTLQRFHKRWQDFVIKQLNTEAQCKIKNPFQHSNKETIHILSQTIWISQTRSSTTSLYHNLVVDFWATWLERTFHQRSSPYPCMEGLPGRRLNRPSPLPLPKLCSEDYIFFPFLMITSLCFLYCLPFIMWKINTKF